MPYDTEDLRGLIKEDKVKNYAEIDYEKYDTFL